MSEPHGEKREVPRVRPFVHSCRVQDGARRFTAYLTDLSPSGARVACEVPAPAPGAAVEVHVRLRRGVAPTRLAAEVKWVQPPRPPATTIVFGVTFREPSDEDRRLLESVLEEFQRRVAELG